MKAELFKDMMSGFKEAVKYRRGQETRMRVARFSAARVVLKPKDIRRVRATLGLSQMDFARYLGTSVGAVRSWEQGVRQPQSAALRLLAIAKKRPAALLELIG